MPIDKLSNDNLIQHVEVEKKILFWGRVEEYKGVDIFADFSIGYPVEIYGKWSSQLILKNKYLIL